MGYHHLALAAKDMKATHDFYERIMGFELVKVEVGPIPGGGWGKHFFYRIDGDDKPVHRLLGTARNGRAGKLPVRPERSGWPAAGHQPLFLHGRHR
jgi:catechol 2,3-dioxygenase-like lactoylglutathione lyase family enzyme